MSYYRLRPDRNRWGMKYGGNNKNFHWYDIVIGIILFIAIMIIRHLLPEIVNI